jgi:hypothetical protein
MENWPKPPWCEHPDRFVIDREWVDFYLPLTLEERERYQAAFPEPLPWRGVYVAMDRIIARMPELHERLNQLAWRAQAIVSMWTNTTLK